MRGADKLIKQQTQASGHGAAVIPDRTTAVTPQDNTANINNIGLMAA